VHDIDDNEGGSEHEPSGDTPTAHGGGYPGVVPAEPAPSPRPAPMNTGDTDPVSAASRQSAGAYLPPPDPGNPGSWQAVWAPTDRGWAPPRSASVSNGGSAGRAVALSLGALLLLAAGVGIGHGLWHEGSSPVASSAPIGRTPQRLPQPSSPGSGAGQSDVAAIASKVDPGLVDINTTLSYQEVQAAGTGILLTASGEVLTNNHVIDGATSISVTDVGNGQTYGATVVGYDVTQDLAVLQLHGASGLHTVSIGNSSTASVGEAVVGVGNAGGTGGTPSAAGGSITALNQSITAGDEGEASERLNGLIESNAGIQPGDSGGPLVNDSGQVLGIDTAASNGFALQAGSGSAYTIPINAAVSVARQIEAGDGSSTIHIGLTAFLGVEIEPAGGAGGFGGGFSGPGGLGQGGTQEAGVVVNGVVTGEPADEAGISVGDVITSLSGTSINSPSQLTAALGALHPGNKVQIGWTDQSGQSHTATVQLASGPPA
jgi:S1-C subfamily serine protease